VDPGEVRRAAEEPVEGIGAEPAAQEDFDVIDRTIGEALHGHRHDPGSGGRGLDPHEVSVAVAP